MKTEQKLTYRDNWPKLANFPISAKVLATSVILIMGIALGQIVVHDLIPTFFEKKPHGNHKAKVMDNLKSSESESKERLTGGRGDLFEEIPLKEKENVKAPFYKTQKFVWLLKWTHIHLFGMNMIFIFMGAIAIFLNMSDGWRLCLVILPFVGVLVDITAMWLRAYVSPSFFWLHLPGGGVFGTVFVIVAFRAIVEMWRSNS
jgi:hypothetical protein